MLRLVLVIFVCLIFRGGGFLFIVQCLWFQLIFIAWCHLYHPTPSLVTQPCLEGSSGLELKTCANIINCSSFGEMCSPTVCSFCWTLPSPLWLLSRDGYLWALRSNPALTISLCLTQTTLPLPTQLLVQPAKGRRPHAAWHPEKEHLPSRWAK